VTGPAIGGSPDVNINGKPALRVGDPGIHAACCGPNSWKAAAGSSGVFINGKAAHRQNDQTTHCGGVGKLIEGSSDVFIGEKAGGGGSEKEKTILYELKVRLLSPDGKKPLKKRKVKFVSQSGKTIEATTDSDGRVFLKKLEPETFDVFIDDDDFEK
jgi:uncharacterized Zn-binding protein involved in type VI secretion